MIRCRVYRCNEPGHRAELAFCTAHFNALTPRKRAQVESLRSLNVLDHASRLLANGVILDCQRYLHRTLKLDARKGHATNG